METIRTLIRSRALSPGEKLPSIRRQAARLSVSPSTVAEAYDRLVAEGAIASKPGSGFFVTVTAAPLEIAAPAAERDIDPLWVSRQSLDARPGMMLPGCGWLPPELMPVEALRRALRSAARGDAQMLCEYGAASGSAALRRLLARRFADDGVGADPSQILLTGSGTEAIDIILRFFLRPGDHVLVDDPCYFNFQALLKAHQAKAVGVCRTPEGPDPAHFADMAARYAPRLWITNSALHNPTGAGLSLPLAHKALSLAAAHGMVVVEDDIFNDFEPEPSARLAALDGLERVIRIGSFSKTLSASIRCGYIAARADWVEALTDLQVATSFGGAGPFASGLVYAALSDGGYRRHMEQLRRHLAGQMQSAAQKLEALGFRLWAAPRGGFFLWMHMPEGMNSATLAKAALEEKLILAPGDVFSPSKSLSGFMRFNVSQMESGAVYDALSRAMARAKEKRPANNGAGPVSDQKR